MSTSPRRNRVDPWGELFADRSRGSLMGNRGLLHDEHGRIRRNHQLKRWIICLLAFKGRRRELMKPGHYTELFFWDEATALAAGHRPCAECQRARYELFRDACIAGRGSASHVRAPELDAVIHSERVAKDGSKVTFPADPSSLPNGTMVARDSESDGPRAFLVCDGRLWRWTSNGYEGPSLPLGSEAVSVLTPRSIVAAFENGFDAEVRLGRDSATQIRCTRRDKASLRPRTPVATPGPAAAVPTPPRPLASVAGSHCDSNARPR